LTEYAARHLPECLRPLAASRQPPGEASTRATASPPPPGLPAFGHREATRTRWAANACANTKAGLAADDPRDPVFARTRLARRTALFVERWAVRRAGAARRRHPQRALNRAVVARRPRAPHRGVGYGRRLAGGHGRAHRRVGAGRSVQSGRAQDGRAAGGLCDGQPVEELSHDFAIMATGRSDYPNQINNVLAFPGVFRGAPDVAPGRSTKR
jgi:hypothetical protein